MSRRLKFLLAIPICGAALAWIFYAAVTMLFVASTPGLERRLFVGSRAVMIALLAAVVVVVSWKVISTNSGGWKASALGVAGVAIALMFGYFFPVLNPPNPERRWAKLQRISRAANISDSGQLVLPPNYCYTIDRKYPREDTVVVNIRASERVVGCVTGLDFCELDSVKLEIVDGHLARAYVDYF